MIRCVIIDDEPVARNILRNYCAHLPNLTIVGEFGNALDARDCIITRQIDLVFLDINMPVLNGVAFLHTLKDPPHIIFTTAYQEYAVQAFDLAACDYLLKPFSLERFIVAVDRVKEKLSGRPTGTAQNQPQNPEPPKTQQDHLFIRSDGKIYKVTFRETLYAEAQGNYTKIVTTDAILLTKISFTTFIAQLPKETFIRVHRSFIINITHIKRIEGNRVWLHDHEIPIAGPYKTEFLKAIGV